MSYIRKAFSQVCNEAIQANGGAYVVLTEVTEYFGGPEEGGWHGHDHIVVAYQKFATLEAANLAAEKVQEMAQKMTVAAKKEYGNQCLREMDWLEERGLDDSFLGEPDGPSEYRVSVCDQIPENQYGPRHFE